MKNFLTVLILLVCTAGFSQEKNPDYDEALAKSLNGNDNGMKRYVFCILKTGTNTTATKEEQNIAFQGHMDNIKRLAKEGKLVVAGPFMKNDKNYRGIFIFNVETVEEAQVLVDTDPTIKSKILAAELTPWFATAALMEVTKIHNKISKNKP